MGQNEALHAADISGPQWARQLNLVINGPGLSARLRSADRPYATCDQEGTVISHRPKDATPPKQHLRRALERPVPYPPDSSLPDRPSPVLHITAGPNGAGKTTLFEEVVEPLAPHLPFVNADRIAAQNWPNDTVSASYRAARMAVEQRDELMSGRKSFATETVFSHPSKAGLIRTAVDSGYKVLLYVITVPEDLAVERVRCRVLLGGHDVPEDRIRKRHRRLWGHLAEICAIAHEARIYDNGSACYNEIAVVKNGHSQYAPRWPSWATKEMRALTGHSPQ